MRKIFLLLVALFATSLMANEFHWAKDFKSGISQAVKEKKPVLFVISSHSCPYCIKLDKETLSNPKIANIISKDFIAVRSWTDLRDYIPMELAQQTPGLPGIWFLLPNGDPMYQPLLGYVQKEDFLRVLATVKAEFDKTKKVK